MWLHRPPEKRGKLFSLWGCTWQCRRPNLSTPNTHLLVWELYPAVLRGWRVTLGHVWELEPDQLYASDLLFCFYRKGSGVVGPMPFQSDICMCKGKSPSVKLHSQGWANYPFSLPWEGCSQSSRGPAFVCCVFLVAPQTDLLNPSILVFVCRCQ